MNSFFNKKRVAFLVITCVTLITLIVLLIVPIGSSGTTCLVYSKRLSRVDTLNAGYIISTGLSSPFTIGRDKELILFWQTVVFTFVGIVFVVFLALFTVELKKAGVLTRWFAHRPTKSERLEARIAELEQQVDDLKKDE